MGNVFGMFFTPAPTWAFNWPLPSIGVVLVEGSFKTCEREMTMKNYRVSISGGNFTCEAWDKFEAVEAARAAGHFVWAVYEVQLDGGEVLVGMLD